MSIWKFEQIKPNTITHELITLNEGFTPVEEINLNELTLFLKREDKNPTGSFKDRGTAFKVTELKANGINEVVISSSGNAAISFLQYGSKAGIKVNVVVSPDANPVKLTKIKALIETSTHELHMDKKARNKAAHIAAERKIPNLRASTDALMPIGYRTIALEVVADKFSDVFVPTSSGTAFIGIAQGFEQSGQKVALHACQTDNVHLIAIEFDDNFKPSEAKSRADAIVDQTSFRKEQVEKYIKSTNGFAWALTNEEIEAAFEQVNQQVTTPISYTSALAVAAAIKATNTGKAGKRILCIASGT